MTTFYTSDTHFNHLNIVEYCNRPFRKADGQIDLQLMTDVLVHNWNFRVKPEDTVYHLGDFGMGSWKEWAGIRARLNGRIVLIEGNHDRKLNHWLKPDDEHHLWLFKDGVFMTHVPPDQPDMPELKRHGDNRKIMPYEVPCSTKLVLCGHVHNSWDKMTYRGTEGDILVLNVGVDVRGFFPVTLEELGVKL